MSAPRLTGCVAHHRSPVVPLTEPPPYLAVCNVRPDGSRPPGFTAYDDEAGVPHSTGGHCWPAARPAGAGSSRGPCTCGAGTGGIQSWGGDEAALVAAVDGLDRATPRPFDVRRAGYRSLWEHFAGNHPEELLRRAEAVVREQQPDLEPSRAYLRRETATPLLQRLPRLARGAAPLRGPSVGGACARSPG